MWNNKQTASSGNSPPPPSLATKLSLALFQTALCITWSFPRTPNLLGFALGYFHHCFVSWSVSHVHLSTSQLSNQCWKASAANLDRIPGFPLPPLAPRDERLGFVKLVIIFFAHSLHQRNCNSVCSSRVCVSNFLWGSMEYTKIFLHLPVNLPSPCG